MRYYLIAGEASGDLHGSNLIKGLLAADPAAEFRFWGGDLMAAAGGRSNLARHYRTASFFGFVEVVRNLPTITAQMRECRNDVVAFRPDVLILIDYPGFNFRMARFAHRRGIPTFYYISPKVWAWNTSRVRLIRKFVTRLYVIFPFEVEWFANRGIEVTYAGNPTVDAVADAVDTLPSREEFLAGMEPDSRPLVALLAGSRVSEIRNNLPFMARLAARYPQYRFVVAGVGWIDRSEYDRILEGTGVTLLTGCTYALLRYSEAAVVTSGTATLETALIGTPQVVCYRGDPVSIAIGHLVIRIRFISLVNIILGRKAVTELIQSDMNLDRACAELDAVLPGGAGRDSVVSDYRRLQDILGPRGACLRTARRMVSDLTEIMDK